MKQLFFALLFMAGLNCFGQDYTAQINSFRAKYKSDFLIDSSSPLKKEDLQFVRFYTADSTYRVTADVTPLIDEDPIVISTFTGTGGKYLRYVILKFMLKGKALELTVYRNTALANIPAYKDYLFLPFTDQTNGATTYGGGRYIDLREGDFKNGKLTLDFNKAYNPYCAFGAGYSCPKPPEENDLAISIEAGEKNFARDIDHQ